MSSKKKYYNLLSSGSYVPEGKNSKNVNSEDEYKIFIKNLTLDAFIGIHPHEKKSRQKISIDIELTAPDNFKDIKDNIKNVVSYEQLVYEIKEIFKKGHVGLLETLSEQISDVCLKDDRVLDAKIEINKLEVFSETESVGIQIFRKQNKTKYTNNKKVLKLKK